MVRWVKFWEKLLGAHSFCFLTDGRSGSPEPVQAAQEATVARVFPGNVLRTVPAGRPDAALVAPRL